MPPIHHLYSASLPATAGRVRWLPLRGPGAQHLPRQPAPRATCPRRSQPWPYRRRRDRSGWRIQNTTPRVAPRQPGASNPRWCAPRGRAANRQPHQAWQHSHAGLPHRHCDTRPDGHPKEPAARGRCPIPASGRAPAGLCRRSRVPPVLPTGANTPAPRGNRPRTPSPAGPRCSRRSAEKWLPAHRFRQIAPASSADIQRQPGCAAAPDRAPHSL